MKITLHCLSQRVAVRLKWTYLGENTLKLQCTMEVWNIIIMCVCLNPKAYSKILQILQCFIWLVQIIFKMLNVLTIEQ